MQKKRIGRLSSDELELWRENEREAIRSGLRDGLAECALSAELQHDCEPIKPEAGQASSGSVLRQNSLAAKPAPDEATVTGEKPVNSGASKTGSALSSLVLSKQIAMAQTSILSSNPSNALITDKKPKTLLEKVLPKTFTFLSWDQLGEVDKLMLAAGPLVNKAAELGYECKPFTLILNKKLSKRLDDGDSAAPGYIRDQMGRQVSKELGPDAWFMYAIEKAPVELSNDNSRRRWHLHGLMIGPAGFSAQRIAPIRRALQSLKGEAASDLMFSEPREGFQSVLRWAAYCAKNEMSVLEEPGLSGFYDLLPGKATFIHRQLLRQTRNHYETVVLPHAPKAVSPGKRKLKKAACERDSATIEAHGMPASKKHKSSHLRVDTRPQEAFRYTQLELAEEIMINPELEQLIDGLP